jgi:hydrogenase nickel incorporation protein HypA/HybF
MHEMAICESILGILKEQARARKFSRVERVRLEIGPFSGVEIEALKFGFDVVMRDSLAAGAALEIIEIQAEAWCLPCAKAVPVKQRYDACPHCGSHQLQIRRGEELRIKELEVE